MMHPCDFCHAPVAPFGFAPAPRLGIPVQRPIKTCAAEGCKAQARAHCRALVDAKDPLAPQRATRRKAPDPTPEDRQPSLL
ncbi:hypothetical protein [Epibacterium sp. Ofav1-8]|uniref:hypothetical protein n=1 Tax=Epibacterium sp. Ofav1-8 TaxID=2917735 RepID=UPI001EF536D8|nr:hypothetical protein [Epibacterium sp. Ofav1-8]